MGDASSEAWRAAGAADASRAWVRREPHSTPIAAGGGAGSREMFPQARRAASPWRSLTRDDAAQDHEVLVPRGRVAHRDHLVAGEGGIAFGLVAKRRPRAGERRAAGQQSVTNNEPVRPTPRAHPGAPAARPP